MPSAADIRRRRNASKEYRLCMLVLGERGIGKKTFLNNLCGKTVFPTEERIKEVPEPSQAHASPDIQLTTELVQLDDARSTPIDIVLFPGCGDCMDNTSTPGKIKEYLDAQFDIVLNEELRIKRSRVDTDSRSHVCIYFIRATSRGLREFDVQLMKQLGDRVNIIPVIGKADLLTSEELQHNKKLIMHDIAKHELNVFDFKNDKLQDSLVEADDFLCDGRNEKIPDVNIRDMLPFALICGDKEITEPRGEIAHVRNYQWGQIVVEDGSNSDFIFLKHILLGSHLQELKDVTNDVFYENYRTKMLLSKKVSVEYSREFMGPEPSQLPASATGSKRRNAFSVSSSVPEQEKDEYMPFSKEMEEKNKIIKAYQQKIEALEKMLKNNPDDAAAKACLEAIM
ncbi:ZYRO0A09482p [Zygosaccharomyces rouxii]|uniref:ZYRO0A09482p n=2 Tax=Zygosaccharomyces rouxii TaxID=4956 RepID=C5DQ85_ZYGRC|nr:uncharacterized protein ZYRO0A09482g [Zygosaccharomyces rouxii]KAH9198635.1 Septin-domain-containing protein [Zygosaccharomyces rouxii]CAR25846.1 ZYRO0A09482p [Zygosaccharomyces rouxii]